MKMRVAALVLAALVRCGSAPEPDSGADCNAHLWPRVIVDLETSARMHVRVRLPDGTILEGNPGGCPAFPGVRCSYSFFTAPADREIVLLAEANGRATERRIVLPPFTREGRNIVHVAVSPVPGIGEPRILSPC